MSFIQSQMRRIRNNVIWSAQGWRAAWASEATLRQWTGVNVVSAIAACLVPMTAGERAILLGLGLLILAAELMNTALEEAIDYISTAENPHAKKAKDCGSAAVAITALAGGVAWVVILIG